MVDRYGMDGGRVSEVRSRGSGWWREMGMIWDGVGFEGGS